MKISPSMHDDLQNVAVDSEQIPQVTLNHRSASPFFTFPALLAVDLKVEPHQRDSTLFLFFLLEVETEENQAVVGSPLSLFFFSLMKLRAPVVFALEPHLDNSFDLEDIAGTLFVEEALFAGVDLEIVPLLLEVVEFSYDLLIAMLGGEAADMPLNRFGMGKVEVALPDFLAELFRVECFVGCVHLPLSKSFK